MDIEKPDAVRAQRALCVAPADIQDRNVISPLLRDGRGGARPSDHPAQNRQALRHRGGLQIAKTKIIAALREHQFEQAAGAAYVFNNTEVFAPGIGFSAEDILAIAREQLPALYEGGPPAIAGDLAAAHRERLLDAGGLYLLGFHDAAARHLPKTENIGSRLRTEVALRMCVFAASHRRNIKQIAAAGCTSATIGAAGDCCPACDEAASRTYRLPLHQCQRCGACTRSGDACRSPSVRGRRRCRMHGGALGSGGPAGERNGAHRTGAFKVEAIEDRRQLASLLATVRTALRQIE